MQFNTENGVLTIEHAHGQLRLDGRETERLKRELCEE